ncbi:MAG: type IV toxin-antitoxin system AbiEi family antitoxin [Actinobacteria bacterium]|nr:type IV toxin-antitoxin system AbiEi family antitoxin [Actinomycetota bacterium]
MKIMESELIKKADARLREALAKVPFIELGATRFEQPQDQPTLFRPDMLLQISTPDGPEALVIEVKTKITPKAAREASRGLATMASMMPAWYGVLVAPYISERSAEICREAGVGYMDLAGNLGLFFDRVYLQVQGRPNLFKQEQELKSLFSPRTSRAVRVMLENPGRIWKVKSLAQEAKLSIGMVSNIKTKLEEEDLLKKEKAGFRLTDPERLLMKWSKKYTLRKNRWSDYYLAADVSEIESKIAASLGKLKQQYAFTLFSAARNIAPFSRYQRVFVYLDGDAAPLIKELGMKQVDSGPNVTILEPYDEGVFYGNKEMNGQSIVGMVQLYLDLASYKGRGEDAAGFLLENKLRKKWP